jgi:hypothetical protein
MFWSGGRTHWINYGDCIGPALVELLSSRKVVYAGIGACELIAAGSILERYAKNKWRRNVTLNFAPLKVWGSGSMHSQGAQPLGRIKIASVRGKGTLEKYGLPIDTPLGDPGILANLLLRSSYVPKRAKWGVIPHLVDIRDERIQHLLDRTPAAKLIDLSNPDLHAATEEIASCELVASSSLHGLISADSLGVPNFRMVVSDGVVGGDWKFEDYASSLGGRHLETRKLDASLDLREMEKHLDFSYAGQVEALKVAVAGAFRKLDF